jgi:RimJ/RimL family protein N-acetyltransferase
MKPRRPITLRRARPDDSALLLAWRNDPSTRRWYLNPAPVGGAEHAAWFGRVLRSPGSRIYVAAEGGRPVGQLRLDRRGRRAEVSFSVAAAHRGRGIGVAVLKRTPSVARRDLAVSRLVAHVVPDNVASAVTFLKAGYRFSGLEARSGRITYVFERTIA